MEFGLPGVADEVDRIGRDVADALVGCIGNHQAPARDDGEAVDVEKLRAGGGPAVAAEARGGTCKQLELPGGECQLEDLVGVGEEQVVRAVQGDVLEIIEIDVDGGTAGGGRVRATASNAGDDAGGGVDAANRRNLPLPATVEEKDISRVIDGHAGGKAERGGRGGPVVAAGDGNGIEVVIVASCELGDEARGTIDQQ